METKLTGQVLHVQPSVVYEIDFEKINTLEDVKNLIKALGIKFFQSENTEEIKHLLKKVK
jgi:hypothetical protein